MKLALALALTGDTLSAGEATAMGLVYRIFADAEFVTEARAFVEYLAKGPAMAHRLIKEAFRRSPDNSLAEQVRSGIAAAGSQNRRFPRSDQSLHRQTETTTSQRWITGGGRGLLRTRLWHQIP
jgi:enoyl-CoA hydratase/carnithine racemase